LATTTRTHWQMVEDLLERLSADKTGFASSTSPEYRLESYAPGWRVRIESSTSSRWVDVADLRSCWETFERLGTICKKDVLEPGRASTFVMALFAQLPGTEEAADGEKLVLL